MECNFCKNILQTKSSLDRHKKNNKKCLEIQIKIDKDNVNISLIKCEDCLKVFSISNINRHNKTCKQSKTKKIVKESNEQIENKYENIIKDLKLDYEKQIQVLKEYILKIETENNLFREDHNIIAEIAKQPKYTNITNNLAVFDSEHIKEKFTSAISNVKPADLYDGQRSIALKSLPCLFDNEGKKMITCTDPSRDMFVLVDKDGLTIKDKKCRKVANIIEPIAVAKTDELIKADIIKREKSNRLSYLIKNIKDRDIEIDIMIEHQKGYIKHSTEWTRIDSKIHKYYELNIIDQQEINELRIEGVFPKIEGNIETCDEKLLNAAEEIKSMKTDCTKFSKTIFEHL